MKTYYFLLSAALTLGMACPAMAQKQPKTYTAAQVDSLLKSSKEDDWTEVLYFYNRTKQTAAADSLLQAIRVHFPKGHMVRNDAVKPIYDESDPQKKEQLYLAWIKQFPPEKNTGTNNIMYDYARLSVASAFADTDNIAKALYYVNQVETELWKGNAYGGVGEIMLRRNHLPEAKELIKRQIDNALEFKTTRKNEEGAAFAALGYVGGCNSYASILYKEKNYQEALEYVKRAYDSADGLRAYVNGNYARILEALDRPAEAMAKIEEVAKAGLANGEMKAALKRLYVKTKGSDAGYADYEASIRKILAEKIRKEVAGKMINQPAPLFTLKDLDGNTVSLATLKGKTVILDFWATWCGPCKRSFPAMQLAVNKYKNDDNVRFLFIDTWEHTEDPVPAVKQFITANKYSFQVLLDGKDPQTKTNKVVESFNITGIPSKFIIDKNGNIRFHITGFNGGDDEAVEELSAMIDAVKS